MVRKFQSSLGIIASLEPGIESVKPTCLTSRTSATSTSFGGLAARPIRPQNTGYEPNFYSYMNEDHTLINIPDSHSSFQCRDDATITSATEDPGVPYWGASSSSKQTAASRVPTMLGSFGASLWKQRPESVDCRASIQATGADVDRESVGPPFFKGHSQKGREIRDTNVVHSLKDRENPQRILERKVDLAVRGEIMAQRKMYEAEVEARNWEKRSSDFSFEEISQEFESQRFQLHQASRWADQAQRDKISLYGEMEVRNRLFKEDQARDCQEI